MLSKDISVIWDKSAKSAKYTISDISNIKDKNDKRNKSVLMRHSKIVIRSRDNSIFTGVNNFGQSVCFAGVIMNEKTAESFTWTFTSFLKMVNNTSPKTFLTDKDQAIIKAVDHIFKPHGTK